jgi:hypothetical protein
MRRMFSDMHTAQCASLIDALLVAAFDTATPTDETTSHSTKLASGQVAGYQDERVEALH